VYLIHQSVFCYLCRGDDGELRLGVRRAVQLKNEALFEDFSSDSAKRHTLSAVYDSLKHRSVFHISYNPRFVDLTYIIRSGIVYFALYQACNLDLVQYGIVDDIL
jgi:hypothetical protein